MSARVLALPPEELHELWRNSARGKAQACQATRERRARYASAPTTRIATTPNTSRPMPTPPRKTELVADTTRDLVSLAVRRFYRKHGWLPDVVSLSPLRFLSVPTQSRDYFAISCEGIGGYTVTLRPGAGLGVDEVECRAFSLGVDEIYHL
ncbi:MAG: hypothetical protein ACRDHZ_00755 [Ktedonobacteraceae bacterium]